ncbi:Nicotinate-nucleotide--dimethylbenzimidazole phosphoribosyltransferase [Desulfovibrio sp. X2]|uniref:nicotinate-nucleotide--dimethylbenzimidazole phosphoribosyltransferase n=1 Tax=Desulfovibrio sp. X2 TaxID=941449 RepID=UPI000358E014|nr:nicotinate-nucleotide--dimethylbenzimidazole phosphoribosyltransferase [Desulfovibrio sp. X2]EPR43106.1 Nicotinate-nucleotide--dimethylbenzimidazole phosphoribosyltransferase [Desulfovibrio sp. X2]
MRSRLDETIRSVLPADLTLKEQGQAHLDDLTKPKGSLGRLEEIALKLWLVGQGKAPEAFPARVYTVAGDHGVVEEGVSLYPQEVTRQMVMNIAGGGAGISVLSRVNGVELKVVDAGSVGGTYPEQANLIQRKIAQGTANMAKGPAMTEEQCLQALCLGLDLAEESERDGIRAVGTGDMGIGNTTPSTALFCAFLGLAPEEITGPGAGLDAWGVTHKTKVIARALEVNKAAKAKGPLAVLAALGGYEIATLAGLIIGCASRGIPVAVDGFISSAAYVSALNLCPTVQHYCFLSHASAEPGFMRICKALHARPLLDLDFRLGEGTGAAVALHLMRCACAMWNEMATFSSAGVSNA